MISPENQISLETRITAKSLRTKSCDRYEKEQFCKRQRQKNVITVIADILLVI